MYARWLLTNILFFSAFTTPGEAPALSLSNACPNQLSNVLLKSPSSINIATSISSPSVSYPDSGTITIPLRFSGRLMLIECIVDSVEGYLVFDTGASEMVFNQVYFRDHVTRNVPHAYGITGGSSGVGAILAESIRMPGLEFQHITAHMADLGHLENGRNVRILGLINFDLFKNYEFTLDAGNGQIHLVPLTELGMKNRRKRTEEAPHCVIPFEMAKNIVFLKGEIGGKRLRFCLDTGAESNVINSRNPKSVMETIPVTGRSVLRGAGKSTREVIIGTMNDFNIGGHSLNGMRTIIANLDPLNEVYEMYIDGMLGYPFIRETTLCFNFAERTVAIRFRKEEEHEQNANLLGE